MYVLSRWNYRAYLYSRSKNVFLFKVKRTVERSVNPENVRMQCGKVKAIIEEDKDTGRMRVVKIIEDKYDSSGYTK